MTNPLYLINYAVFAVFMVLLLLEGAFAITSIFAYEKYKKKLMRYITPIWEVNGTFAVFYIVNFEATFPKLLGVAGTIYAVPLLVAAALIIIRNSFLIYGQYVGETRKEARYLKIYAAATIVALILALSVMSSSLSGIGVNLSTATTNLALYLNPFNLIVIASALLISVSLAASVFHIDRLERMGWVPLAAAIALIYIGISLFASPLLGNIWHSILGIALLVALVAALAVLQARRWSLSGVFTVLIVAYGINVLGALQYPYVLGSLNITNYMNSSALSGPIFAITLAGGAIVAIALSYLIYLSYLRKK
jgi:cytochrome d ubiquinol oxidase subunit II